MSTVRSAQGWRSPKQHFGERASIAALVKKEFAHLRACNRNCNGRRRCRVRSVIVFNNRAFFYIFIHFFKGKCITHMKLIIRFLKPHWLLFVGTVLLLAKFSAMWPATWTKSQKLCRPACWNWLWPSALWSARWSWCSTTAYLLPAFSLYSW